STQNRWSDATGPEPPPRGTPPPRRGPPPWPRGARPPPPISCCNRLAGAVHRGRPATGAIALGADHLTHRPLTMCVPAGQAGGFGPGAGGRPAAGAGGGGRTGPPGGGGARTAAGAGARGRADAP